MPKQKKQYDDDDGRVISDMSDVGRAPLLIPRFDRLSAKDKKENTEQEMKNDDFELTGSERRAFVSGALGAALAIGGVFAAVGFLIIFALTRLH